MAQQLFRHCLGARPVSSVQGEAGGTWKRKLCEGEVYVISDYVPRSQSVDVDDSDSGLTVGIGGFQQPLPRSHYRRTI